jgi:4'-phosphopantetheinyl transferase
MVSVWWMRTDRARSADCRRWLGMLNGDERTRADCFRFKRDRREFIAAHALLRGMLAFHLGRPAAAWQFAPSEFGKPRLAKKFRMPEIDFNLSHTRGLVAAALVSGGSIGIDAEQIDRAKADLEVAQTYFAPSEIEILRDTPQSERATCFFRLWTLKEACLKAAGAGFSTPLDSFAFTLTPIRIKFLANFGDLPPHWYFETLPTTGEHVLSLAAAGHGARKVRVVPRAVQPQDL